jgi:hypothetical protein
VPQLISDKNDPQWQRLYKEWLQQDKPGHVVIGGKQYRVLHPSDEEVKFELSGGFDHYYGSQSKGVG